MKTEIKNIFHNVTPLFVMLFFFGLCFFVPNTEAAVLKSVQSGEVNMGTSEATTTVSISSIDTTKSFLVFGASRTSTSNTPAEGLISGKIVDDTNIQFERIDNSSAGAVTIKWYVPTFYSGVSVQNGEVSLSATGTTTVVINAISLDKAFPLVTFMRNDSTQDFNDTIKAEITSPTTLDIYIGAGTAPHPIVRWQVVEFTDGATVKHGNFVTTAVSVTVATSSTPKASWLLHTSDVSTNTNDRHEFFYGEIMNTSNIRFTRDNSGSTADIAWYLIEFTDGTIVNHGTTTSSTLLTISATSSVVIPDSIATAGGTGHSGGTAEFGSSWYESFVTMDFSGRGLSLTRGDSISGTRVGWFIVDFVKPKIVLKGGTRLKGGVRIRPVLI